MDAVILNDPPFIDIHYLPIFGYLFCTCRKSFRDGQVSREPFNLVQSKTTLVKTWRNRVVSVAVRPCSISTELLRSTGLHVSLTSSLKQWSSSTSRAWGHGPPDYVHNRHQGGLFTTLEPNASTRMHRVLVYTVHGAGYR